MPSTRIGENLYLSSSEEKRAVFFGTTPIYVYDRADEGAEAACMATLSRAGLAKDVEIASAFGVHRNGCGSLPGTSDQGLRLKTAPVTGR